jgi:hypothetical protein
MATYLSVMGVDEEKKKRKLERQSQAFVTAPRQ